MLRAEEEGTATFEPKNNPCEFTIVDVIVFLSGEKAP